MANLYGANFELKIDVNSQSLVIAGAEAASLQQQLRFLVREQTIAGRYTAEQLAVIDKAITQTNQSIQDAKVRNRELFQTLSVLPGPIGQIAGQTQLWITGLRELSKLNFKDVTNDLKNLFNSFGGAPIANIGRTTAEALKSEQKGGGGKTGINQATDLATVAAAWNLNTKAYDINTAAGLKNKEMLFENAAGILKLQGVQSQLVKITNESTGAIKDFQLILEGSGARIIKFKKIQGELSEAQAMELVYSKQQIATIGKLAEEMELAAGAQNALSAAEGANIPIVAANTAANWTWSGSLLAVNDALVLIVSELVLFVSLLGASLVAIGAIILSFEKLKKVASDVYDTFKNFAVGTGEMEANIKKVSDMIDDTSHMLDLDLQQNKRTQQEKISDLKKSREGEKTIREQGLKDLKDNLTRVTKAHEDAKGNLGSVVAAIQKEYGLFGVHPDQKKADELLGQATKQIEELEKQKLDVQSELTTKTNEHIEKTDKESFDRRLRNLDARINNETKKEQLSSAQLKSLYDERNNMIDDFYAKQQQKLTKQEEFERTKQQKEKVLQYEVDINTKRIDLEKSFNEKLLAESSKGTEQYYRKKAQIIEENFQLEMEKARLNEKTRLTNETIAYTKRYTELENLENEKLKDQIKLKQDQLNGLYIGSQVYYNKERELEEARYKEQKQAAKDNADELEAIEKEHQKKMTVIKSNEQSERGKMENQEVALGQELAKINGAWWTKFDDAFYARKKTALYSNYVAQRDLTEEGSEARKAVDLKYAQDSLNIEIELQQAKKSVAMRQLDWTQQIFDSLLQLSQVFFKGNKDLQHALLALSSAAQIAKVVIDANAGVAGATAAAAAQAPIPGLGEVAAAKAAAAIAAIHISEAISIAGIVAATAAGWAQIDGGGSGGGSGSGADRINRGKNYGQGGYISGPSHELGGVPAVLEGGEAVMTRGAVTAFAPLLSIMNQAGGGTSFSQAAMGQAKWDNPKIQNGINEPQIIKTYIVESELTTNQQKQARLKQLSTL